MKLRVIALAALVGLAGAACSAPIDPNSPQEADDLTIGVPPQMAGLDVFIAEGATKKMAEEIAGSSAYVRDGQVFELRGEAPESCPVTDADDTEAPEDPDAPIGQGNQAPQPQPTSTAPVETTTECDGPLQAVFQVLRLTPDARTDDFDFRRTVANSIGGTSRAPENIGGVAVYQAVKNSQVILTWFEGKFMQVLMARETQTIEAGGDGFSLNVLLAEALALQPIPVSAVS